MRNLVLTAMALAGCGVVVLAGQQPATRAVYTAAQADAGRTAYRSSCVKCHGEDLIPPAGAQYMGQTIPPLAGPKFLSRWNGQATSDLAIRIRTAIGGFPPKNLGENTWLELTAYVLQSNGARPGSRELTPSTTVRVGSATATPVNDPADGPR